MRLPPEIRIRIYEYVFQPATAVRTPCFGIDLRRDTFYNPTWLESLPPAPVTESEHSKYCSKLICTADEWPLVEGRLAGSTCELRCSTIRDIRVAWSGVLKPPSQPNILRSNKQIYHEAAAILYEQCRICVCTPGRLSPSRPSLPHTLDFLSTYAASHVRRFHLRSTSTMTSHFRTQSTNTQRCYLDSCRA